MLVTTEKLHVENIPENACPKCNGAGQVHLIPLTCKGSKIFNLEVECSNCNGEKIVTQDLLDRKQAGNDLRKAMNEKQLILREVAKRYGGTIAEWSNAKHGRASLDEIKAKIKLVKGE